MIKVSELTTINFVQNMDKKKHTLVTTDPSIPAKGIVQYVENR
jgi:hypothetical protein